MATQQVYVIDDDEDAREAVLANISVKGHSGLGFPSAEAFLAAYQKDWKGCILVDLRMPGMTGMEFLNRAQELSIPLPIIVITGHGDVTEAVQAMRAGAFTFLGKDCEPHELTTALEEALATEAAEQDRKRRQAELQTRYQTLTEDEKLVFDKLVEGLPNKRIASDLDIGLRTVELRRSNIMKKMIAGSLAELVRMAISLDRAPEVPL